MNDLHDQLKENDSINKYKTAGKIASFVLNEMLYKIKTEVNKLKIFELCEYGNKVFENEINKYYKEIKNKGLSYPILVSKNNIIGNYIANQIDTINNGDLIKIELGVQIDGYPAILCYTTLATKENEKIRENDKRNKTLKSSINVSREIFKLMKPGNKNTDIMRILNKYAIEYNCEIPTSTIKNENYIIPGVISFQISRNIIDGNNDDSDEFVHQFILHKKNNIYDYSIREFEFEENDIFVIDIVMMSDRRIIIDDNNALIYKRNFNKFENLKLKSSKDVLSKLDYFPKILDLNNKNKLGLKECINKKLINIYPLTYMNENEYNSRIKFTVIVKDNPILITGRSGDEELFKLE